MISRKKKILLTSAEVSVTVSYTISDVRKSLKRMFALIERATTRSFALTTPNGEIELAEFFEKDLFHIYEADTRKQLARWAIVQAEKDGSIFVGTSPNTYYLSPELAKRPGRPTKGNPDNNIEPWFLIVLRYSIQIFQAAFVREDRGGFLVIYLVILSWDIFGSFWDIFGSFCLNLVYMIFNQEK